MNARFPEHETARLMAQVDQLRERGDDAGCIVALRAITKMVEANKPNLLQEIGQRFTALGMHTDATHCFARALQLQPDNAAYLYNHATALIATGQLTQAEAALDRVIALTPEDGDAWYNRATLRKQTIEHNHVASIEQQVARPPNTAHDSVPLHYALAKELEDLGEHTRSFTALKRGADTRRKRLAYGVEADMDTMQMIREAFDGDFFAKKHIGDDDTRPLFVVGLPRSGSTLVDRIISSHSAIISRGESTDFAVELVRTAGPVASKAALVTRSTQLDFRLLGERYVSHLRNTPSLRQIDKTPANFLYLGLISAALPQARIIHIKRQPMDACYAMYKTLFRTAYPFSYDLQDLGHYWLAYQALMTHWRKVLPSQQFFEIDYEELVTNQEVVSRQLIAHVGLPWEDACLNFERNQQPSFTASAAQIRQPIYNTSVALWRRYERELAPLSTMLRNAGIDLDTPTLSNAQ